jgi:hypothetical protein
MTAIITVPNCVSDASRDTRGMRPPSATEIAVETLENPARYSLAQIARAFTVALVLKRGKLVLCEPPAR